MVCNPTVVAREIRKTEFLQIDFDDKRVREGRVATPPTNKIQSAIGVPIPGPFDIVS